MTENRYSSFDVNIQSDENSLPPWLEALVDPDTDDAEIDRLMDQFL